MSNGNNAGGKDPASTNGNNTAPQTFTPKKISYRELFDQLSLGIVKSLIEKRVGVTDVHVPERKPVDKHALTQWEQKYSCLMPEDLRNFYMTTDGFILTWSVRFDDVTVVPVGRMELNCLSNLVRIGGPYPASHAGDAHHHRQMSVASSNSATNILVSASASAAARSSASAHGSAHHHHMSSANDGSIVNFADLESDGEDDIVSSGNATNPVSNARLPCNVAAGQADSCASSPLSARSKPRFDFRSRVFELEPCGAGNGKVCLVYHNTKPGIPAQDPKIWFLDRALRWHFMAESFTHYFRLMLMHIGLPQWQYAFTDIGLSPQVKQWFNLYAPVRLSIDSQPYCCPSQNHTCKNFCSHQYKRKDPCGDGGHHPSSSHSNHLTTIDINRVFKGRGERKKGSTGAGSMGNASDKKKISSAKVGLK